MFKFIYKKRFLFVLLFILFLLIFSSNVSANIFNGNPEIVDKLNSAFEKIESWMLKLATPAAAVAVAVGLFMKKFSKDFLLGAATSAHQVEGNNIYSDYWAMEQMKNSVYLF